MKSDWIVPLSRREGASMELFCFPYAGGGSSIYAGWADALPACVDVFSISLPGRGARFGEPPVTDFIELIGQVSRALRSRGGRPRVLFGHSLGALVAFEVARNMSAWAMTPDMLFVSGRQAPGLPPRRTPIAQLPDDAFLAELRELGGTPSEVLASAELVTLLMPMLRADFALAENHRLVPGPRLACPVVAMGGMSDPWVHATDLEAWSALTDGPSSVRMFPGDHFYLHQPGQLLAHLSAGLTARHVAV